MCIAFHKPIGVSMSKDLVSQLWDKNKDGAGWLAKPNVKSQWFIKKGMMDKDKFLEDIEKYLGKESELVAHMRIKTTGTISAEHTHPFQWTGDNKTARYLFHNGTVKFLNPGLDSDSMLLADILSNFTTEEAHDRLKDFAANGCGRFVTLTNGKITTFGDEESVESEGIWFSNKRHLTQTNVTQFSRQPFQGQTNFYHGQGYMGGGSGRHDSHSPAPFRSEGIVETNPEQANIREKSISVIANYYAAKKEVICNHNFIKNWSEENGTSSIATPVLSKIADFCKDNKGDDPFFDFFLALQSK